MSLNRRRSRPFANRFFLLNAQLDRCVDSETWIFQWLSVNSNCGLRLCRNYGNYVEMGDEHEDWSRKGGSGCRMDSGGRHSYTQNYSQGYIRSDFGYTQSYGRQGHVNKHGHDYGRSDGGLMQGMQNDYGECVIGRSRFRGSKRGRHRGGQCGGQQGQSGVQQGQRGGHQGQRGGQQGQCGGQQGKQGGQHGGLHTDGKSESEGHSRHRPPPGLKGREIGMWYAEHSKKKKKDHELKNRTYIQMDESKARAVTTLLCTIRSADNIQPQPSSSYKPITADDSSCKHAITASDSYYKEPVTASDSYYKEPITATDSYYKEPITVSDPSNEQPITTYDSSCEQPFTTLDSLKNPQIAQSDQSGNHPITDQIKQSCDMFEEDESFSGQCSLADCEAISDITESAESYITSDNESGWIITEEIDSGEEDISGDMLAMMGMKADTNSEDSLGPSLHDKSLGPSLVQRDESQFMVEFRENKLANRQNQQGLQGTEPSEYLRQNPNLDYAFKHDLEIKMTSDEKYIKMQSFRRKLPSYKMRNEILRVVSENQVTVLSGETGCGKTTQVAQFILDDYILAGRGSLCRVVCTQPRRISAITVAERVAAERAEACGGGSVGYQIRLENKLPRTQGSILYCTTGIMLKWLVSDPWLSKTSHVILDEVHERDLLCDFLMIILKDLIQKRPDLKLILMSATLNAEMFSKYFGRCPMLNIPGFTYPVEEYMLEDIIEMTRYRHHDPPRPKTCGWRKAKRSACMREHGDRFGSLTGRYSENTLNVLKGMDDAEIDLYLVEYLIQHIHLNKQDGAILVFVPGWEEISKLNTLLSQSALYSSRNFRIIPLHSLMPTVNQKEVFERPPPGVRKIVIATNIAETSITIEDVVFVIDCGKIKLKNFDPSNNIATLQPEWVSRANAKQRRGRAGRVRPGECYHLYTTLQEQQFADYQLPEILRTPLEELCLQIKLLKLGRIEPFIQKAIQTPSMEALHLAVKNLIILNALDAREDLTPLGYHLAKMPIDPYTGKMLLFAAMFSCLDPILTVAASLSFKDAFHIPLGKERLADKCRKKFAEDTRSDHLMLINAYEGWERACMRGTAQQFCHANFMSSTTLMMLKNMRRQFTELLYDMKFIQSTDPKVSQNNCHSSNEKLLKAVICAGLYPNVARIQPGERHPNSKKPVLLQSKTDRRIKFHPKSINCSETEFQYNWFIYHLKMKTSNVFLYDSSMVSPYPLLFFGGSIDVRKDHGQDCIVVDDWIIFRSSRRIANLVKELRSELDKLLEHKICHPSVTNWDPKQREGALMYAIMNLITTEEHKQTGR